MTAKRKEDAGRATNTYRALHKSQRLFPFGKSKSDWPAACGLHLEGQLHRRRYQAVKIPECSENAVKLALPRLLSIAWYHQNGANLDALTTTRIFARSTRACLAFKRCVIYRLYTLGAAGCSFHRYNTCLIFISAVYRSPPSIALLASRSLFKVTPFISEFQFV